MNAKTIMLTIALCAALAGTSGCKGLGASQSEDDPHAQEGTVDPHAAEEAAPAATEHETHGEHDAHEGH